MLMRLVSRQMFRHTDGTVINIAGIPRMYDYECFPQVCAFLEGRQSQN
jgi:hypothetical protein